jgi:hypothetical protein
VHSWNGSVKVVNHYLANIDDLIKVDDLWLKIAKLMFENLRLDF